MSEHEDAVAVLRQSGLIRSVCEDLFELYLEDCDEHSPESALFNLIAGIEDESATKP